MEELAPQLPPNAHKPRIPVEEMMKMTSAQLREAIAIKYDDYNKDVVIAFLSGAVNAFLSLGIPEEAISPMICNWAVVDEQMYVATLYERADQMEAEFAKNFVSPLQH